MASDGATSPKRRAQSAPIDLHMIMLRQNHNKFQPLAEHNSAYSNMDRDWVKGNKKNEPIPLKSCYSWTNKSRKRAYMQKWARTTSLYIEFYPQQRRTCYNSWR